MAPSPYRDRFTAFRLAMYCNRKRSASRGPDAFSGGELHMPSKDQTRKKAPCVQTLVFIGLP